MKINRYDESIKCYKCENSYHIKCVDVTLEVFDDMRVNKTINRWSCNCENNAGTGSDVTSDKPVFPADNKNERRLQSDLVLNPASNVIVSALEDDTRTVRSAGEVAGSDYLAEVTVDADLKSRDVCEKLSCVKCALQCEFLKRENILLKRTLEQALKRLDNQEEIIYLLKITGKSTVPSHSTVRKHDDGKVISSDNTTLFNDTETATTMSCGDNNTRRDVGASFAAIASGSGCSNKPNSKSSITRKETEMEDHDRRDETAIGDEMQDGGGAVSERDGKTSRLNMRSRRARIPEPVIGSNEGDGTVCAVEKLGYLFVYRMNPETTEDGLGEYLKNAAPKIKFQCSLVKKTDMSSSFRVSFPLSCLREVYEPDIWPKGAAVRRFFFRRDSGGNFREKMTGVEVKES